MYQRRTGIYGRQKVVRGLNVQVLTSHAGLNTSSKSSNEREMRVVNDIPSVRITQVSVNSSLTDVLYKTFNLTKLAVACL